MCSMSIGISRRPVLNRTVAHYRTTNTRRSIMTFGEKLSSDQLPVTVLNREFLSSLTSSLPPRRNRTEIPIGKASSLRPDSSIEKTDNNIGAVIGIGPETALVPEAEKLRRPSGVKLATAVLEHGED